MGLTLYVGSDESNHGNKRSKEIIVSAFSLYHEDGKRIRLPSGRDYGNALSFLDDERKGWAFTLNGIFARQSLTKEVPGLIDYWMKKKGLKKDVARIFTAFDGVISCNERMQFREDMFRKYDFEGLVDVRHHSKNHYVNGKKKGKFYDSKLVWAADSIASHLLNDLRKKENLIVYPEFVDLGGRLRH